MSNSTCFFLCVLIVCATVYLCQNKPTGAAAPQPVATAAPVVAVVPTPAHVQLYNRLPNGELVPVVEETPQQFEQSNAAAGNDPLADPKDPTHHTTQDLIDGVNKNGL